MNELYDIWNKTGKNLDDGITIDESILSRRFANKIRLKLFMLPLRNIPNVIIAFPFILFLINFARDHYSESQFLIASITLILLTTLSAFISLLNIITYLDIRPYQPVYQTQEKLEKLLLQEVWENKSLILIIPLFGLAFIIVAAKYFANIDILNEWGYHWIIYYLLGSLIIAAILVFFLQLFPDHHVKKALKQIKELKMK